MHRFKLKNIYLYWDIFILALFCLLYILTLSYFSILRHNAFASNYDLANMDQTIWNTLHGHFFTMTSGDINVSRLATHADFILILLTPFYLIWDNVRMLLFAQSLFLGLGGLPVYLIARKILKSKILSLVMVGVYLLNPGMQWTNIYDFHGVALAIPFLLFSFYFALSKHWKLYWLFFVLSLTTKEEVSLFLFVMGFFIGLSQKNWKISFASMFISLIWFFSMTFYFIPSASVNDKNWAYQGLYKPIRGDLADKNYLDILSIIKSDALFPNTLNYYTLLLKPYGFLPLLGLPWVLMSLPELLINVLSTNALMQTITNHYDSVIVAGFIIATIYSLRYIQLLIEKILFYGKKHKIGRFNYKKIKSIQILYIFSFILLFISMRFDYHYSPLPFTPSCWCISYMVSQNDQSFDTVLSKIPTEATVTASGEVRPHISHRQYAYSLPTVPQGVDYIAIIDQNRIVGNYFPHPFEISLIQSLAKNPQYTLTYQEGHFYLFKLKGIGNK